MRSEHHPNEQNHPATTPADIPISRPAQCLRHHVWMAACDDCRDARTARRERSVASR